MFTLEHSRAAYRVDFILYGAAVVALATGTLAAGPREQIAQVVALILAGLCAWSAIEYALHRFVLHGLAPFRQWHALHHERPAALICALTFGVVGGYLAYAVTHHATHHWRADSAWLRRRRRWHALHHHARLPGCYAVTSAFWDRMFGTVAPAQRPLSAQRLRAQ